MIKTVFSPKNRLLSPPKLKYCHNISVSLRRMAGVDRKRPSSSPAVTPNKKTILDSPINEIVHENRPFRVSIEGNIGAGKSTLIRYFENFGGIETFGEPLDWWRNVNGHNLLELMYSNTEEWLKVFQSYVQLTRLKIQTSKPKNPTTTVQIFERSVQNNRYCFIEQAYKNGLLTEPDYYVLDEWYKWVRATIDIDLDLIVYLRSSPEVVYQRMKNRGRPEEAQVSFDYLKQLHESHENWLMNQDQTVDGIPILVLDADQTLDEIIEQYRINENRILGYDQKRYKRRDQDKAKKNLF